MGWITDILRFLREIADNEALVHSIQHMGLHSFNYFVRHNLPHFWENCSEFIGDIFDFVIDFLTG
jgi:hypothetical protein